MTALLAYKIMDEKLIRHAYDQSITYAARLSAYASAKRTKNSSEITEKQDTLAKDDLMNFSYHTRRLLALTDTRNIFSSICIPMKFATGESFNFEKILSIIIHNELLEPFRTEFEEKILFTKTHDEAINLIITYGKTKDTKQIPTGVFIKSDNSQIIRIELNSFLEIFEKSVLPIILETCSEAGLHLDLDA